MTAVESTMTSARSVAPECPKWCDPELHDTGHRGALAHYSDPRIWTASDSYRDDSPTYEVTFHRGDEITYRGEQLRGDIDMDVRVSGGFDVDIGDDGQPILVGSLSADGARRFATFLREVANEIDPHNTNGVPLEWVPGSSGPDGD